MCQELGIFTLTNIFHVAVRLFSNRSQKTLKCVKTKKWHTSRADVFRPHFDVLSDLLLNRTHGNMESVCFIRCLKKKGKKTDTHTCLVPFDCQRICASLGIFYIQALLFVSGSSFFSLPYFVHSIFETFLNVFSCSNQNNGQNTSQNRR